LLGITIIFVLKQKLFKGNRLYVCCMLVCSSKSHFAIRRIFDTNAISTITQNELNVSHTELYHLPSSRVAIAVDLSLHATCLVRNFLFHTPLVHFPSETHIQETHTLLHPRPPTIQNKYTHTRTRNSHNYGRRE